MSDHETMTWTCGDCGHTLDGSECNEPYFSTPEMDDPLCGPCMDRQATREYARARIAAEEALADPRPSDPEDVERLGERGATAWELEGRILCRWREAEREWRAEERRIAEKRRLYGEREAAGCTFRPGCQCGVCGKDDTR